MRSDRMNVVGIFLALFQLTIFSACGIPRAGDNPAVPLPEVGQEFHLPVTPDEAITLLRQIAPQSGWKMIRTGDQVDMRGQRGKYFWLEADKLVGGKRFMSGVFFNDPAGTYAVVGKKDSGFPEWLIQPMMQAVAEARKQKGQPPAQPRVAIPVPSSSEVTPAQSSPPAPARSSSGITPAPARSSSGIAP